MSEWEGKSKTNVLGYQFFYYSLRFLGLHPAYLFLCFVSPFYVFFSSSRKHIYDYFKNKLHFSTLKSIRYTFKNYYVFGQVIIDKIYIQSGLKHSFQFNFDGKERLEEIVKRNEGGILISAHLGNWAVAGDLLSSLGTKINVVMLDEEHQAIKQFIGSVTEQHYKVIAIKQDLSHLFEIKNAIDNKEIICIHGDRFIDGSKTFKGLLLDVEAHFPAGPFKISKMMEVPTVFVYGFKQKKGYNFYCSEIHQNLTAKELFEKYVAHLEKMIQKYPEQWFNYYDFWK